MLPIPKRKPLKKYSERLNRKYKQNKSKKSSM